MTVDSTTNKLSLWASWATILALPVAILAFGYSVVAEEAQSNADAPSPVECEKSTISGPRENINSIVVDTHSIYDCSNVSIEGSSGNAGSNVTFSVNVKK